MLILFQISLLLIFFFVVPASPGIYTLSLRDALPISGTSALEERRRPPQPRTAGCLDPPARDTPRYAAVERSEEHTSELQSQSNLVCRLLLEKKNISGREYHQQHSDRYSGYWHKFDDI